MSKYTTWPSMDQVKNTTVREYPTPLWKNVFKYLLQKELDERLHLPIWTNNSSIDNWSLLNKGGTLNSEIKLP